MKYGILKDTKAGEFRVISTPGEVRSIVNAGHNVYAERGCGLAAGFSDESYAEAGAITVESAKEIFDVCDLVGKVKEFSESEFSLIREGQILLSCIHPAANSEEVDALLKSGCIAFTAEDSHRFASPNSEAAGKQGALFGLESMLTINGGKGKFVGGLAGAPRMSVLILGCGAVGRGALEILHSLGAACTVMDISLGVLREVAYSYGSSISTALCNKENIAALLPTTDMVINAVKWPKERRDFLIDREMLKTMERGSVLVDISNDSPGAIETSRATTHESPRYTECGVVHYCVSNIPAAIANSTSVAYGAEMLPMILSLLTDGVKKACIKNGYYRRSLCVYKGYLTHEETSAVQERPWIRPEEILKIENERLDIAPPATSTRSENYYKCKA